MGANTEYVSLDMVEKEEWERIKSAGGGSGGGVVYVPFSVTKDAQTDEFVVTTTTSFSDVVAALDDGKVVIGQADLLGTTVFFLPLSGVIPSLSAPGMIAFSGAIDTNALETEMKPSMMTIWMGDNGNCIVKIGELTAK